jgi:AraC-like DNA-binding protein
MILDSKTVQYKGMPLFQKARFKTPFEMEGKIEDFACFFYMVEGGMMSFDSRGAHKIGTKEAIIKNCNNYVQRYIPKEKSEECEAIAIYLYPALLNEIYKDEIPSFLKNVGTPSAKKLIGNELIEQYINNLSIYFENPEVLDEDLAVLKLKELMMILLKSENHNSIRNLLAEIFTPIHVEFKEAIAQNLFNQITLKQLAFICNMSLSSFKRKFKAVFDNTPAKYIKQKRLEHAASLLLYSQDSIGNIAFDSGFLDLSTFSASFQEKFETSPTKYRSDLSVPK